MVFSSPVFLFYFMPVVFFTYYIVPKRFKNGLLVIASLFFYAWGEIRYIPIMILSTLVDYFMGWLIESNRGNKARCRAFLLVSICFNVGSLMFFKYTNFFITNINSLLGAELPLMPLSLPLGISFYTFQTMSYTIDVYKENVPAQRNLINFAAFVTMFPQLVAGPIVKYVDVNKELAHRTITLEQVEKGIIIFIMGLGSKVLVANNIGALWDEVAGLGFSSVSTPLLWMAAAAFALQIYFDFSGYSLMAIGMGHMLGFRFPPNFNYPYISKSITEFWRRWHMTLGSWFREYIYIPLGGNRVSRPRQYFNMFVVWFITGFWHGADWNFIIWGLFFFVILCMEKSWLRRPLEKHPVAAHVYLIVLIILSWPIFAVSNLSELGAYFKGMFVYQAGNDWMYYLRNYGVTLVIGVLLSTPLLNRLDRKIGRRWVTACFAVLVLLASTAYLVNSSYNPFLYFRF